MHDTFSGGRTASDDPLSRERSATRNDRPLWSSRSSFLLAAIGAAVGTGNVWRFPYLCYKYGGGSFLIPYTFALFVLAIPIMILELGFGQHKQKGFVYALHEIHPALAGLGWGTVLNTFLSCVFYCVVMAWSVLYFFYSFTMPWEDDAAIVAPAAASWRLTMPPLITADACDGRLAEDAGQNVSVVTFPCAFEHQSLGCTLGELQYALATPAAGAASAGPTVLASLRPPGTSRSEAERFFFEEVLHKSGGIEEFGSLQLDILVALAFVWGAIYFCIRNGVRSTGRVVWITVPAPCFLLFVLLMRGLSLEGAGEGLLLFITPQMSLLGTAEIWQAAAVQVFYSTSCALGVLPTYVRSQSLQNTHRSS